MKLYRERTIKVCVRACVRASALEGGPFAHKYRAAQFHFHWGRTSDFGAEHLVDGHAYAAEVSTAR